MIKKVFQLFSAMLFVITSCNNPTQRQKENSGDLSSFQSGSFGYDLNFLQQHDSIIVLKNDNGKAQLIVSPKYQAKVFTSTADGDGGISFGWVNYKAFTDSVNKHMNAYGGENRLWLGPEGGKFSLFFKPGAEMIFDNWKTPAPFDTEPWKVTDKRPHSVTLQKNMKLVNYQAIELQLMVERTIKILDRQEIEQNIGLPFDTSVKSVGYTTHNVITNEGNETWTETTGMPCLWMLDMFKPSPQTVIVIPFKNNNNTPFDKIATTNYFGEIPASRLHHTDNILFFKADGKSRGKLGIIPENAKPVAGSYDPQNKILTIIIFDVDSSARYLNQEWNIIKPSFSGDAVNAYNDGPLADGSQMGPFYEIESVSPAAFLQSGQSLSHTHSVYHFTGNEKSLDAIASKLLGVSIDEIKKAF